MSKLLVPRNNRFYSFLSSSKHFWVFWISSFQSTQGSMTAGEMSLSACSVWASSLVQECLGEKVSAANWTQVHSGCQRWSIDDFMWHRGARQEFKLKSWQKVDENVCMKYFCKLEFMMNTFQCRHRSNKSATLLFWHLCSWSNICRYWWYFYF